MSAGLLPMRGRCLECGFDWELGDLEAREIVRRAPDRFAELFARFRTKPSPDPGAGGGGWTAKAGAPSSKAKNSTLKVY